MINIKVTMEVFKKSTGVLFSYVYLYVDLLMKLIFEQLHIIIQIHPWNNEINIYKVLYKVPPSKNHIQRECGEETSIDFLKPSSIILVWFYLSDCSSSLYRTCATHHLQRLPKTLVDFSSEKINPKSTKKSGSVGLVPFLLL